MTMPDPVPAPARSAPDHFRVALPAPLDVPASLAFLGKWGDDLLDRWDGTHLVRTVNSGGRAIPFVGVSAGTVAEPALDVTIEHTADRPRVEAAVRHMFVFAPPEFGELLARDPLLAALDARHPGLREVRQLDLFAALVRAISAQQVNLRWATTTRRRLAEAFGERHVVDGQEVYSLAPARLAEVEVAAIRALQFTTRKAEYRRGGDRAAHRTARHRPLDGGVGAGAHAGAAPRRRRRPGRTQGRRCGLPPRDRPAERGRGAARDGALGILRYRRAGIAAPHLRRAGGGAGVSRSLRSRVYLASGAPGAHAGATSCGRRCARLRAACAGNRATPRSAARAGRGAARRRR